MTIPITNSQSGEITPDDDWGDDEGNRSAFSVNSVIGEPAIEEPVRIVNPVEEAATSATTESAGESISAPSIEVPSVIEEIVPEAAEEAATAATTMQ